ncbi:hypothetical protein Nepgr_012584 [Nepenthes gracilis]|uniref:Uncharacterized protein n=1 Tax=Nepenthes gracilis TaxID=150966 RepID=A0AAD3SG87_NEPGR|nr:hypothetical protein Nepgr_012584 [Nepenthes gracilis]
MAIFLPSAGISVLQAIPTSLSRMSSSILKPVLCLAAQPVLGKAETGIMCEPCNGTGWLTCDFCKGQKTNVKSETNRIYRRCPSCRAIGYILCTKCKVFKCVTFPDHSDGKDL